MMRLGPTAPPPLPPSTSPSSHDPRLGLVWVRGRTRSALFTRFRRASPVGRVGRQGERLSLEDNATDKVAAQGRGRGYGVGQAPTGPPWSRGLLFPDHGWSQF